MRIVCIASPLINCHAQNPADILLVVLFVFINPFRRFLFISLSLFAGFVCGGRALSRHERTKKRKWYEQDYPFLKSSLSHLLRLSLPLSIRDSNLGRILTAEGDIWELLLGCCYGVYSKLDCEYSIYLFFCSSAPYIL